MTQSEKTRIPGMMQIMAAVAKAADMKIDKIMASERRAGIIHARAAIYKLATEYGYPKSEIMWYLDRDRTVGYNYDRNLAGHLSRNSRFLTLYRNAAAELNNNPHRAKRSHQRQNSTEITAISEPTQISDKEPKFKPWKSKLGWSFTAEEERRAWYACRAAEEFMRNYGQPSGATRLKAIPTQKTPTEMRTIDAAIYLGVSEAYLTKGVKLGHLHRYKKPKDSSYWFSTSELDNFRIYIAEHMQGNK